MNKNKSQVPTQKLQSKSRTRDEVNNIDQLFLIPLNRQISISLYIEIMFKFYAHENIMKEIFEGRSLS